MTSMHHRNRYCGGSPFISAESGQFPRKGKRQMVLLDLFLNEQVSLHTAAGCSLASTTGFSGQVVNGQNCGSTQDSNTVRNR
jgi:hypothetical protein